MAVQFPFPPRRSFLLGGKPRIDWNNPLAAGLIAAYVPSGSGTTIYNLAASGSNLVLQSGATYANTVDGQALNSTAVSSAATCLASSALQPTKAMSVYWRGVVLGAAPINATWLIGVQYTNSNTFPYFSYGILHDPFGGAGGVVDGIYTGWNTAGSTTQSTGGITTAFPTRYSLAATFKVGGNVNSYNNGLVYDTTAFGAGAPTYDAAATVLTGGWMGDVNRYTNANMFVGYIWNRELSAKEVLYLEKNPYGLLLFEDDFMAATLRGFISASPNLTGVTGTSAVGSVRVALTQASTMQAAAFAVPFTSYVSQTKFGDSWLVGTYFNDPASTATNANVSLTGVSATSSVGSVVPNVLPTITGVTATATPGTLTFQISTNVNITGVSATASPGSVVPTISPTVTGVSATASPGSLLPTILPTLTGVSATASPGSSTPTILKSITGVSATATAGSVVPTVLPTLTGVSATASPGTLTFQISTNVNITGVSATASPGSVTPTVQPTMTGVSATGAVGSVAITAQKTLSGVSATATPGSVTPTVQPTLSGVSATASPGSVTPTISPTLSGVSGTSAVGSLAISESSGLSGVSSTSSTGTLGKTISPTSTGVSTTGSVGSAGITISPTLTGVSATGAVGSVDVVVGQIIDLTGVSATATAGSVFIQIDTNVNLTGVSATGAVGSVRVDKSITIPGLPPTGDFGAFAFVQDRFISVFGLPPNGGIGNLVFIRSAPPTSGTYSFDLVYADIILQAYAMTGFSSESLETNDLKNGLNQINLILGEWMNEITMSTMIDLQFVPLTLGQITFQCPVGTDDIHSMAVNRNGYDLIMERISHEEYDQITNKTAPGLPFQYYVNRTPYAVTVYLWQAPNVSSDVIKYYRKKNLQDAVAYNNITGLRPRWVYALTCELAVFVAKLRKVPRPVLVLTEKKARQAFAHACAGEAETAALVIDGIA